MITKNFNYYEMEFVLVDIHTGKGELKIWFVDCIQTKYFCTQTNKHGKRAGPLKYRWALNS